MASVLEFDRVSKVFATQGKRVQALKDVTLEVDENSFTSIIGPSGCGKSSLLKLISGLSYPNRGKVRYKGNEVRGINTDCGFVTQESKLFPWLTLMENVELPLKVKGVPLGERRERAKQFINMVGLTGFENHHPHQLSGGMQKRGSIIRTLVYDPEVILMDEPFGPLDAQTRGVLQNELLNIWSRNKKTILFVTHDLTEAVALSDKVVLMTKRPGTIKRVFDIPLPRPRNVFEIHFDKKFTEIYHEIWDYFRSEIGADVAAAQEA